MSDISEEQKLISLGVRAQLFQRIGLSEGSFAKLLKDNPNVDALSSLESLLGKEVIVQHRYDYVVRDCTRAYEINLNKGANSRSHLYTNRVYDNGTGSVFEKGKLEVIGSKGIALNDGFPYFPMCSILDVSDASHPSFAGQLAQFKFQDMTANPASPYRFISVIATNPSVAFLYIVEDIKRQNGCEYNYHKMRLEGIGPIEMQVLKPSPYRAKQRYF